MLQISYFCGIGFLIKIIIVECKFIYPSAALTPFVKYYWVFERDFSIPVIDREVPKGFVQLMFYRKNKIYSTLTNDFQPKAFIEGQMSGFWDVKYEGEMEVVAVAFTSQGVQSFLNIPVGELYNKNTPVECLGDKSLKELEQAILNADNKFESIRIIEHYLLKKLAQSNPEIAEDEFTIQQMEFKNEVSIKDLSNLSNLCYKQFNRNFVRNIGINPKRLIRILRFQKALSVLQKGSKENLSELAFKCGYFDASHIHREIKEFSGYTLHEFIGMHKPFSDYFLQKELILSGAYDEMSSI